MSLLGPYLAACALLVVAGGAKALRPGDTARAVKTLAPTVPTGMSVRGVRAVACAEALLGLIALWWPVEGTAIAVAASYAAFAAFVLLARARGGPLATCGCFGTPDTPPTLIHVVVDLGLAAAAGTIAATATASSPARALPWLLQHQFAHGVPLVVASGLCAWVLFLVLARLPQLQGARMLLQRPSVSRP